MLEWIETILTDAVNKRASDIHLSVGSPVVYRIDGEMINANERVLSTHDLENLRDVLLPKEKLATYNHLLDYDFSYHIPGLSRFRMNIYNQRKGLSVSIRVVSLEIPTMSELGLPSALKQITKTKNGIFLVTGPTGSGKSTTLASMVQYMNERYSKRILTLEDPIEFVYENQKCVIEQRELGSSVHSFESGIRGALRQDPDVLLVGEMRDLETISAAITAAETGHLVLSTLHTNDAPKTIDRIIDAFPPNQQPQVRNQLASLLSGVVSQQLVKRANGKGMALATELLLNNSAISNLIRTEKVHQIHNIMQTSAKEGMHTLVSNLEELKNQGIIHTKHDPY